MQSAEAAAVAPAANPATTGCRGIADRKARQFAEVEETVGLSPEGISFGCGLFQQTHDLHETIGERLRGRGKFRHIARSQQLRVDKQPRIDVEDGIEGPCLFERFLRDA